jgi:hypothetical protein
MKKQLMCSTAIPPDSDEQEAYRRLCRVWALNIDQFRRDGLTWEVLERNWRRVRMEAEAERLRERK